ncbi:MAG: UDP-3-O-[3-hydroxymyristoyl] N-acetylglucosamine deacetylase [Deltaproteobacteria bacterium]|nr:UDP-3-O-[3-hydroxymyristoyl] N-acetylglucosamine deacetylase [Deltaproteobacteria bacterium]MBI3294722.1 UDP-3-O-[3-hydroxymyristoyl] N-acetylglucosamine deacetylase [Deltaproteobacteria bacterium]
MQAIAVREPWYGDCFCFCLAFMTSEYFASERGYRIQKTIARVLTFEGVGLHSGCLTQIKLTPSSANTGIRFERVDLRPRAVIAADADSVVCTALATTLGLKDRPEARVGTVEHLLAALYALGITNLCIEVNGPEIPILDGSAGQFIDGILGAGIRFQPYTTPILKVLKPVKVYKSGAICELLPRDRLRVTTSIDFAHPDIGLQTFAIELTPGAFRDEICSARTFGFLRDVESLKTRNLARGASVANVLALTEEGVLNEGGMRFPDECVRHKTLDAIGDLSLSGSWLQAEMVSFRGGHSMHLELLNALKASPAHWSLSPAEFIGHAVESPTVFA